MSKVKRIQIRSMENYLIISSPNHVESGSIIKEDNKKVVNTPALGQDVNTPALGQETKDKFHHEPSYVPSGYILLDSTVNS